MTTDQSPGENDVPTDTTANTTSDAATVGRTSDDETGDTDQSGGERRAGRTEDAHDGALRDE